MPKSVAGVMHEFKHGELHSGSPNGPRVTQRKQAIAIALSEQRQQGKSVPAAVPHPHRNLGRFLHPPKAKLADQITKLRTNGAFQAPRGAQGY